MKKEELTNYLQLLFNAARQATLTAPDHEKVAQSAEKLMSYINGQFEEETKKKK